MQHTPQRHINAQREAGQMMQQLGAPKPGEQTHWFMVEEQSPALAYGVPESYSLEELLRRFPDLAFLCDVSPEALTGYSLIVVQEPERVPLVRIYPDA